MPCLRRSGTRTGRGKPVVASRQSISVWFGRRPVGRLIWFAIRRITNYEIGLVAIVVGILVGKAVHKGSAGVGGLGYQLLAVVLTYGCIAANYMPDIIESMIQSAREQRAAAAAQSGAGANQAVIGDPADDPTAGAVQGPPAEIGLGETLLGTVVLLGIVFAFALATPFLAGAENLIGLLIIGFALWEAWKLNARRPLPISGPYQLGPGPAPSPVA